MERVVSEKINHVEVDVSTKKFPQEIMLLDKDDLAIIDKLPRVFCAETKGEKSRTKYARTGDTYIHRLIMGSPKGLQIDHINVNGLDNRRSNLRIVTNKSNGKNTAIGSNNTTGHIGVSLNKNTGKYEANIKVDYKKIHLGVFSSFEEACLVRKEAEKVYGFHKNHGRD